jgi:Domain of unknown function (DUF1843)
MATKKAAATTKRATSVKAALSKHPKSPFHPLYGRPILDAVKSGNVTQMRQIRSVAQKHVKEVNAALAKLDARLKKG